MPGRRWIGPASMTIAFRGGAVISGPVEAWRELPQEKEQDMFEWRDEDGCWLNSVDWSEVVGVWFRWP